MFWRILGIPDPHLPTREETNIGEIDLMVEICCSSARWFGEEPPEADFNHKAVCYGPICPADRSLLGRGQEL